MLKNITIVLASVFAINCGVEEATQTTDRASMVDSMQKFESSRQVLETHTDLHLNAVMSEEGLNTLAVDELNWSDVSSFCLSDMRSRIRAIESCIDAEGGTPDVADTYAALDDLDRALIAHQIGMLSMIDLETAQVAETVFHTNQMPLLDELHAHYEALNQSAERYDCGF